MIFCDFHRPPAPRKPPERRRRSSDDDEDDDLSDCDRENKEGSRKREAPRSAGNLRKRKKTGGIKNTAAIEALELATEQTLKVSTETIIIYSKLSI